HGLNATHVPYTPLCRSSSSLRGGRKKPLPLLSRTPASCATTWWLRCGRGSAVSGLMAWQCSTRLQRRSTDGLPGCPTQRPRLCRSEEHTSELQSREKLV